MDFLTRSISKTPSQTARYKKKQDDRKINLDFDLDINKDFEETSPYQEGVMVEIYQRLDKSQLLETPELANLINTNNLV